MKTKPFGALALLILLSALAQQSPAVVSDERLLKADSDASNWLAHGRTYSEQRFSPLDQVNADNVSGLRLAWYYDLDTNRGQEATPLVVDGVMYTTSAWSKVFALDAASGKLLWKYDPHVPGETAIKACCDVVNRGAAVYGGKVFAGTLDGRLIALDSGSGKLVWSVQTTDPAASYTITGAPRVVKGKVIIGNGGADILGVRGYVTAYDADTGKLAWRFYTIPGDPKKGPDGAASDAVMKDKAAATWFGKWYQYGGGGTAWDAIVYDAELDQLYIGTGNGLPWNQRIRSDGHGDNLFLCSIIALRPSTGEYLWHYQVNPGEAWDYNAAQPIMLADLKIAGQVRKVLMQAPKNGFFYVIDRHTGRLISTRNIVPVNWATGIDLQTGRPRENPEARYEKGTFIASPGGAGAHNWQPMAYSPVTRLVYIPVQELPMAYRNDPAFAVDSRKVNSGIDWSLLGVPDDPEQRRAIAGVLKGRLLAWDPVAEKEAWHVEHGAPWNGGVLATGGNLVFEGASDRHMHAYRATDGHALWTFDAQTAVIGGPISYKVGSTQYVAVMAGNGGAVPLALPALTGVPSRARPGRVLAFALTGTAALPKADPIPLGPPIPADDNWDEKTVSLGSGVYSSYCARCHGSSLLSTAILPDLRRSPLIRNRPAFESVVLKGALSDRGMVSFAGHLTEDQVDAVRAYISAGARLLQRQSATQQ